MKRVRWFLIFLSVILFSSLWVSSPAFAAERGIDLSVISTRENFSFINDSETDWRYSARGSAESDNGYIIDMMLICWGKDKALQDYPELRFFVYDSNIEEILATKAMLLIDGNLFEIALDKLNLNNTVGAFVFITLSDESILKSFATAESFHLIVTCEDVTIQATISAAELSEIRNYATDMIRYDFVNAVDQRYAYQNIKSAITAYVFNEADMSRIETVDQSAQAASMDAPAITAVPEATATPKPMSVSNGLRVIMPDYEGVCPLTVEVSDVGDFYVYLQYQSAPSNSKVSRKQKARAMKPYESDLAFYVRAGKSVNVQVPIGVYKLYYSTGKTFFGSKLLFGDETRCYSSDELLTFYYDGTYYQGMTLTLRSVVNGNFDTDPIEESQFPRR